MRDKIIETITRGTSEQHAMRLKLVTPMEIWVEALRGRLDEPGRTIYRQGHTTQLRTRSIQGRKLEETYDAIASFTRQKMQEESIARRIFPPVPATSNTGKSTTTAAKLAKFAQAYGSTPNVSDNIFGLRVWYYSALGVLCDLYLRFERQHKGDASWRGSEFQWLRKGKLRRSNGCKKVPTPVRAWWERCHPDLPFRHLKMFLRNPHLEFQAFADLLEMHGPWT